MNRFLQRIRHILCGAWACLVMGIPAFTQYQHGRLVDLPPEWQEVGVRVIAKDAEGFMWIGTNNGLLRYDGSQVRAITHNPQDPGSIMNSTITCIAIDTHRLWAGGALGVTLIDLRDNSLTNIRLSCDSILDVTHLEHPYRINVWFIHPEGDKLWIATQACGLLLYELNTGTLTRFSFREHAPAIPQIQSYTSLDEILGFTPDPQNDSIFWIGTSSGLIRFNKITYAQKLYYIAHDDIDHRDVINTFRRIYYHDDGLIYYITWGAGVNIFDPVNAVHSKLQLSPQDNEVLRRNISYFWRENAHAIWLRTTAGVGLYDTGKRKVVSFFPNDDPSLLFHNVEFTDEKQRRWSSTNKGIYVFDPLFRQHEEYSYQHLNLPYWWGFARKVIMHPDGRAVTVLGQDIDALYHLDLKNNQWSKTVVPGHSTTAGAALHGIDIAVLNSGDWFISSLDNLFIFDPVRRAIHVFDIGIPLIRRKFTDVERDHEGTVWIGTRNEGILRWDPRNGKTVQFLNELYGDDVLRENHLASNLLCDSRGNIWFKTANGHSVYDASGNVFHRFDFRTAPAKTVLDLARFVEDSHGKIWVVTHEGVLASGHRDAPAAGVTTMASVIGEGMTPHYVHGLVAGDDDNLYVLSSKFLFRVDSALNISRFSFEYTPFRGGFYSFDKFPDGRFLIGMRNRFALLDPGSLHTNDELPSPYLTRLTINETPVNISFSATPDPLDLRHHENFVSFSFSAVSYTLAGRNQFRYRLHGFDPDWIDAADRRYVNYTNIPSGTYHFELQAANNEGLWNPDTYRLSFTIAKAWWATWWFLIAMLVCIASIVYLAYRYHVGQIRKEANLKSEFERKIADIELSALKAQMNPHFIFNCLNSIENYIIKNESIRAAEYINDFARLIRLILQNSRSQHIPLTDEIEALSLYLQMESLRFDNKFEYAITVHDGLEPSEIDIPPMLIQPFVENAIWHGLIPQNTPGRLEIDISRQNGILHCVIEDNGIGRERSRQINASMHKRGKKSMGMLITKNRIDVINELYHTGAVVRIIDLKDDQGNGTGTRVELNIPV